MSSGSLLAILAMLVVAEAAPSAVLPTVLQVPGRQLYVRSLHGVDGFQSDLYEIFMEPYGYEQRPMAAVAVLAGQADAEDGAQVRGELVLTQARPPLGPVRIRGNLTGLSVGAHGLHVHTTGDVRDGCTHLGGHFNPHRLQHGGPDDALRHAGDLGNVVAGDDGVAQVDLLDAQLSLAAGPRSVLGRALAVTAKEDDLGRAGSADSVTAGSSGKPLACGTVALLH